MTSWESWEPWEELYRVWEKRIGKERLALTWPSLKGLWQWFARETERRNIDVSTIDVESFLDPTLSSEENRIILLSVMTGAPTEEEYEDIYEQHKALLEQQVREKYGEIVEPWLDRIVELERTETTSKKRYKQIKALELQLAETEKLLEEERAKPPEVVAIKIRVLKPFTEGILDYTVGSVIETKDLDWVLEKIKGGFVERVGVEVAVEIRGPPKPLSTQETRMLEDEFKAYLMGELGRVPPNVLAEYRVTLRKVMFLPYEEALQEILGKAREIVVRQTLRLPRRIPTVERPPKAIRRAEEIFEEYKADEETFFVPYVKEVDLPKSPIGVLPFPRAPSSEEKQILWERFEYDMTDAGLSPYDYRERFDERMNLPFRKWEYIIKTYVELVEDIKAGTVSVPPLHRVAMPWRETTEELWRFDAIVHFLSIKIYKSMDELVEGLITFGVIPPPTSEEIEEAAKKAYAEKNIWFTSVYPEDLAVFGIKV